MTAAVVADPMVSVGPVVFVDTNILAYCHDSAQGRKKVMAEDLLARLWQQQGGRTSMQVLNELYVTLTRKLPHPLPRDIAWRITEDLLVWSPLPTDRRLLTRAREVETRYRLNWWDALIVAAAQLQDCTTLLTEDLQDGMDFDGVRVGNPFRAGVAEEAPPYSTGPRRVAPANPRHRGRGRPRRQAVV